MNFFKALLRESSKLRPFVPIWFRLVSEAALSGLGFVKFDRLVQIPLRPSPK